MDHADHDRSAITDSLGLAGYLMLEPVEGLTRLDHAINAGLVLAWVSLQGGDLVGTYGFDAAVRQ